MKYEMDCGLCGEPVVLSRQSFLKHFRGGTLPICRKNGCYRYERSVAAKGSKAARKTKGVVQTHVAGKGFLKGGGKAGHQHSPLADGRVARCLPTTYDDAHEVG